MKRLYTSSVNIKNYFPPASNIHSRVVELSIISPKYINLVLINNR